MNRQDNVPIRVNDKIEIKVQEGLVANSLIQEVEDDFIGITVPVYKGQYKFLERDGTYEAIVYQKQKTLGLKIQITGKISGNVPLYRVRILKDLGTVQRRDHVRVPANLPFRYASNKNLMNLQFAQEHFGSYQRQLSKYLEEGIVLDISAGGINFSTQEKLQIGSEILMFIDAEDLRFMGRGQIRHHRYADQGPKPVNHYGVQFVGLDFKTQDAIVKHVFRMMRKAREY